MPITFTINHEHGYFITKYVGKLSDKELLESWEIFLEGDEWIPGLNELADLSELDAKEITYDGIRRLTEYTESIYRKHNVTSTKVGVYAPKDLPFGLARVYENMSNESPEEVCVFREMEKAKLWIAK